MCYCLLSVFVISQLSQIQKLSKMCHFVWDDRADCLLFLTEFTVTHLTAIEVLGWIHTIFNLGGGGCDRLIYLK